MRVKIISDGKPTGTLIIDAETGEIVKNVRNVKWSHDATGLPQCELFVLLTEIDVETDAEKIVVCPKCEQEQRSPEIVDVTSVSDKWEQLEKV